MPPNQAKLSPSSLAHCPCWPWLEAGTPCGLQHAQPASLLQSAKGGPLFQEKAGCEAPRSSVLLVWAGV